MSVLPTLSGAYLKKEKIDTINHKAILNSNFMNRVGIRLNKEAIFGVVKG